MKISQLKKIIREEIKSSLNEVSSKPNLMDGNSVAALAGKILSKKAAFAEIEAYADIIEHIIHALATAKPPRQPNSLAAGSSDAFHQLVEILSSVLRIYPKSGNIKKLVDLLGAYANGNLKSILSAPSLQKVAQTAMKDIGKSGWLADEIKEKYGSAKEKSVGNRND